jgi:hypothetical protein
MCGIQNNSDSSQGVLVQIPVEPQTATPAEAGAAAAGVLL